MTTPQKLFTKLITAKDIELQFGYDLMSMVTIGGFGSAKDAVEAWLDEACESINELIMTKCGYQFTKYLNNYLTVEENKETEIYKVIFWAQMYEMRFFIDNGRFSAVGKIDNTRKKHSEEAIRLLYNAGILRDVIC